MHYNPDRYHRRSIRLKGYDYRRTGMYFVTIVTQGRACVLGEVVDGAMRLNEAGQIIERIWAQLSKRYSNVQLDAFIVMPNHIHGIIVLSTVGAPLVGALANDVTATRGTPSLGEIIGAFKSLTTLEYFQNSVINNGSPFIGKLWQRNYYEHIIRDERSLTQIQQYIIDNPKHWYEDHENPAAYNLDSMRGGPHPQ